MNYNSIIFLTCKQSSMFNFQLSAIVGLGMVLCIYFVVSSLVMHNIRFNHGVQLWAQRSNKHEASPSYV